MLIAQSKSGRYFTISSVNASIRQVTEEITLANTSACAALNSESSPYGAGYYNYGWRV